MCFRAIPQAFWKVHDAIFENQDLISPENVCGEWHQHKARLRSVLTRSPARVERARLVTCSFPATGIGAEAEKEFKRGTELGPNVPSSYLHYAQDRSSWQSYSQVLLNELTAVC